MVWQCQIGCHGTPRPQQTSIEPRRNIFQYSENTQRGEPAKLGHLYCGIGPERVSLLFIIFSSMHIVRGF